MPFMQTARAIQRYSGEEWMEVDPIVSPLTFTILSATLPEDVKEVFPKPDERDTALNHPRLQERTNASKPAQLIQVNDTGNSDDQLMAKAVELAQQSVANGRRRVSIMVNRVARASRIAAKLRELVRGKKFKLDAHIVLMTGRMRPIDRDQLVEQWSLFLRAGSTKRPDRPIILVTTQCLEVGADFSFDALITECASLDALRQRFGRLNRLGKFKETDAAVLARKVDFSAKADDPIYGTALKETWDWLNANSDDEKRFDFGISAVDVLLPNDPQERSEFTAPSPDAPVMLPAHVDLLCQTAPVPTPDPDVGMFLHGPQRNVPEARVVFRADLVQTSVENWRDAVSLLPPLTVEALTLPLGQIRKWLGPHEQPELGDLSDIEGQQTKDETIEATSAPFIIWRGRQDSVVSHNPDDVKPNETIVVPAHESWASKLDHVFCRPQGTPLDVAERAYPIGRGQHVLRLLPEVYQQYGMPDGLADVEPLKALLTWAKDEDRESSELIELLKALHQHSGDEESGIPALPTWLRETVEEIKEPRPHIQPHPARGLVLLGHTNRVAATLDLDFGDIDDGFSEIGRPVALSDHVAHVRTRADTWARRCLPDSMANLFTIAAELHDVGKADPRFQIILHGDEVQAAVKLSNGEFLAKSDGLYRSPAFKRRLRAAADLPNNFHHEMLSMQLAQVAKGQLPEDDHLRQLVLHLIASHHGHARPFAPVCIDDDPPDVELEGFFLTHEQRCNPDAIIPPHRLDSGVAERFWQLTRRYGWWGFPYFRGTKAAAPLK